MITKTIGSWSQCDLVVVGKGVSQIHCQAQLADNGFLTVLDAGSDEGTFLQRNQQWIRILKIELGSTDRIRCGEVELEPQQFIDLFGERVKLTLHDHEALRLPARVAERLAAADKRATLERPRRNPRTGDIEEDA